MGSPIAIPAIVVSTTATTITMRKFTWIPGSSAAGAGDEDVQPVAVVDAEEEVRAQPAHRVGADREEGDVAQVEQAREADDDVEPERHHDVRQGEHRVVDERAAGLEEERQRDRADHHDDRDHAVAAPGDRAQAAQIRRLNGAAVSPSAHPASLVSSPSRPRGRTTMISTR